jgi:Ca2+-binding RTX toxin-like protein
VTSIWAVARWRPILALGLGLLVPAIGLSVATALGGDAGMRDCQGERASIIGTPGADDLRGTKGRDVVVLGRGDDFFAASDGEDLVCAGLGADALAGGADSDAMFGEAGEDSLLGKHNSDVLRGGTGRDFVYGSRGESDRCNGGAPSPDGKEHGDKAIDCESVVSANRPGHFRP